MQRFTISLDDTLAAAFDDFIAHRGDPNRSEAFRAGCVAVGGHAVASQGTSPRARRPGGNPRAERRLTVDSQRGHMSHRPGHHGTCGTRLV